VCRIKPNCSTGESAAADDKLCVCVCVGNSAVDNDDDDDDDFEFMPMIVVRSKR
jgi:hypothetical protein